MGKIQNLTREQKIILDRVKASPYLRDNFYFTGGTALKSLYLNHRNSEDLDFFTDKPFHNEVIFNLMENWHNDFNFSFTSRFREVVYVFVLTFPDNQELKVDFSYYGCRSIKEREWVDGIKVDSLTDIAVNKLLTIQQRTEVKDFVDLYFLLKDFSLWDLIEGVKLKFGVKIDILLLASDFLKVKTFETLPEMIEPLTLEELKDYFVKRAKELGLKSVV